MRLDCDEDGVGWLLRTGRDAGGGVRGFGDLESVIMHMVWDHDGPVTVRELFEELRQERVIAYTTVMSTMDNLHRKGWLDRDKDGKAYRYTATASREEYSARLMREALAGGGDTEAVLSHFVAQIGGAESEVLRTVVRRLAGRRPG
jgi:predicted transcriptional regulator